MVGSKKQSKNTLTSLENVKKHVYLSAFSKLKKIGDCVNILFYQRCHSSRIKNLVIASLARPTYLLHLSTIEYQKKFIRVIRVETSNIFE